MYKTGHQPVNKLKGQVIVDFLTKLVVFFPFQTYEGNKLKYAPTMSY